MLSLDVVLLCVVAVCYTLKLFSVMCCFIKLVCVCLQCVMVSMVVPVCFRYIVCGCCCVCLLCAFVFALLYSFHNLL